MEWWGSWIRLENNPTKTYSPKISSPSSCSSKFKKTNHKSKSIIEISSLNNLKITRQRRTKNSNLKNTTINSKKFRIGEIKIRNLREKIEIRIRVEIERRRIEIKIRKRSIIKIK